MKKTYLGNIKGEPGRTPVKGVDYFDGIDGARGPQGPAGRDGKDGKDGVNLYSIAAAAVSTDSSTVVIKKGSTTGEIQAALDSYNIIYFEKATYMVDQLMVKSNTYIDFREATLKFKPGQPGLKSVLKTKFGQNITLKNGFIDGNREFNGGNMAQQDGGNNGIAIEAGYNILIENMESNNNGTDGLYIDMYQGDWDDDIGFYNYEDSKKIKVISSRFDNNMRQGSSIMSLVDGYFIDCEFTNTNGKAPEAGVDFEPDNDNSNIQNVEFNNCRFYGNGYMSIVFHLANITYRDIRILNSDLQDKNGLNFTSGGFNRKCYIEDVRIENSKALGLQINNFCKMVRMKVINSDLGTLYFASTHDFTAIDSHFTQAQITNNSLENSTYTDEVTSFIRCTFDNDTDNKNQTDKIIQTYDKEVTLYLESCTFKNFLATGISTPHRAVIRNCTFINPDTREYKDKAAGIQGMAGIKAHMEGNQFINVLNPITMVGDFVAKDNVFIKNTSNTPFMTFPAGVVNKDNIVY